MEHTYEWIRKAQEGDKTAKEKLIEENSGLIWSIVKRFTGRAEQDDLFQIGAIGLLKCIDKFDFRYQVKFSTYAVPMIMGEIRRYLRDDGTIKVSRGLKELSLRIRHTQEEYLKKENRELSVAELSEILKIEKEEIFLAMESSKEVESLFRQPGNYEQEGFLIDKLIDPSEQDNMMDNLFLKEALNRLNDRERNIILLRYFHDKTQMEVAKRLGISQVQVSRTEKKILRQMHEYMK